MADAAAANGAGPRRFPVVAALGVTQILAWGSSYYLLAVLAPAIAADTGWTLPWVVGGLTFGLVTAGLVSPRVGRAIERHGGRPILVASTLLFALGLGVLAVAPNLAVYLAAWLVLGLAMGSGLYDAAFATLGRAFGQSARQAIGVLTLFGGFASTVCWPLSATLVAALGWRGTCLAYALLHLGVALPLHLLAVPPLRDGTAAEAVPRDPGPTRPAAPTHPPSGTLFVLVAATITLGSAVSAVLSVHLLTILQGLGLALAGAVALGAVVGPSQVGARAIELAVARHHHPVWTMVASTALVTLGVGLLGSGWAVLPLAIVCYGAGIGIASIARGTLPLALFGAVGYAAVMGRLALPSLLAQAGAPMLGAVLIERAGPTGTLAVLLAAALTTLVLALALLALTPRSHP